jgi:Zn-dependent peptidase ImmA (M78 family)
LGILVLPCELSGAIAAFSFADSFRGPTIVYNPHHMHENIWVLRFTIAHELCHLLFDRAEHEPLGRYTAFDDMELETTGDPREVRANAFAVHFLMPYAALSKALLAEGAGDRPEATIRGLMERFGLHFKAMRLHLKNFGWLDAEAVRQLRGVSTEPTEAWFNDIPPDKDFFPVSSIPIERRGILAREVVRAWCEGSIDLGFLREILRAAPGEPFESLPEVYGLQAPSEAA